MVCLVTSAWIVVLTPPGWGTVVTVILGTTQRISLKTGRNVWFVLLSVAHALEAVLQNASPVASLTWRRKEMVAVVALQGSIYLEQAV